MNTYYGLPMQNYMGASPTVTPTNAGAFTGFQTATGVSPATSASNSLSLFGATPNGGNAQGNDMADLAMLSGQLVSMLTSMISMMCSMLQQVMAQAQAQAQNNYANMFANTNYNGNNASGTGPTSSAGVTQNAAMQKLAATSKQMLAKKGSTSGQCVRGVNDTMSMIYGENNIKRVPSAYQEADVLAGDSRFQEIKVSKDQLKSLPAGCIIIWGPESGNPHGHATITQGNGREISDHEQNLIVKQNSWCRVFIPKG
jgi:hypothetical protein